MDELLINVKNELGITINDNEINNSIKLKIKAIIEYLNSGGANIPGEDINYEGISTRAVSCISIGVNDLLNNKAGDTKFSPAFNMLAMQICRG